MVVSPTNWEPLATDNTLNPSSFDTDAVTLPLATIPASSAAAA